MPVQSLLKVSADGGIRAYLPITMAREAVRGLLRRTEPAERGETPFLSLQTLFEPFYQLVLVLCLPDDFAFRVD